MPQRWTETDDVTLHALHDRGLSLNACAKEMARPTASVGRAAKRLGISWDRSRTDAAIRARVADSRARRAALHARSLDLVEGLMVDVENARAGGPYRSRRRGEGGGEVDITVEGGIVVPDLRDMLASIREATTIESRLAPKDDAASAETGKSLVGDLLEAMRATHD